MKTVELTTQELVNINGGFGIFCPRPNILSEFLKRFYSRTPPINPPLPSYAS